MNKLRLLAALTVMVMVTTGCRIVLLASVTTAGGQVTYAVWVEDVSADGRYVLLRTVGPLDPADTNGTDDLYRRDTRDGVTIRVSVSTTGGNLDAAVRMGAEMSDDGNRVAYATGATNAVAGDTNSSDDVILRNISSGSNTLVSRTTAGLHGNDDSYDPAIAGDGSLVAYTSDATNLVPGDTNGLIDVFSLDLGTGTTARVSTDGSGNQATVGYSGSPSVNGNGDIVAFETSAPFIAGDGNSRTDIYLKASTGYVERVSVSQSGGEGNANSFNPSLNYAGTVVAFGTAATNLAGPDTDGVDDILVRDVGLASTTSITASLSIPAIYPSIDGTGDVVAFQTGTATATRVRVWEAETGLVHVVSVDPLGTEYEGHAPRISHDGRYVGYHSDDNITDVDTNTRFDVYLVAHREPLPASVSPAAPRGGPTNITITGSGFEQGATVSDFSGTVSFNNVVVQSSTQITATVLVPTGAPVGPAWFNVRNPDGGPGFGSGGFGNCQCLTIS